MTFEYDEHIALQQTGPGEFLADIQQGWVVGGGVNGGYLLAVIGNAIRQTLSEADQPDPFTISSYYLSATQPGPATVRVEVVRRGGTVSTVSAVLTQEQDGQALERITALASFGNLGRIDGRVLTTATPPELPPVEECVLTSDAPPEFKAFVPMLDRFAMRLDPACAGWVVDNPSGVGMIQGWFKLVDDRPIDTLALLTVVDTLPPVTFELGMPGWAPTLELTVHVRSEPAPGWLRIRHETRNFAHGFFEEDCEVWDSADRLVAQSRQLALAPRPV
jgi:hypothetical protein